MKKTVNENIKVCFIYLLKLIASVLNGKTATYDKNADWNTVLELSKKHSVQNLLYYAVASFSDEQKAEIDSKIIVELAKIHSLAVVKESNQQYYADEIIKDFEKNHIKNMPVKGFFLKNSYPSPDMRAMSDIDILYDVSDYKQIKKLLTENHHMTIDIEFDTTISFNLPPYFHLEMHSSLVDKAIGNDYLEKVFDRATKRNSFSYSYKMTDEDAYIYMLYHTAGHCVGGGIGIKMIMDFYVFVKEYGDKLDWEYVNARLKETSLFDFEQCIKRLSFDWFSLQSDVKELDRVGEFVLLSGTYGRFDVSVFSELLRDQRSSEEKNKKSNRVTFFLKAVFPPYSKMAMIYPIVKKMPFLYPFSWVFRWFHRLIQNKNKVINKARLSLKYVDEADKSYYQTIMEEMGLDKCE